MAKAENKVSALLRKRYIVNIFPRKHAEARIEALKQQLLSFKIKLAKMNENCVEELFAQHPNIAINGDSRNNSNFKNKK